MATLCRCVFLMYTEGSTDCGQGNWMYYKGFCYLYNPSYNNFDNSRKDCFSQGATLLTIYTLDERGYVEALLAKQSRFYYSVRIALNDMLDEGKYAWDDGSLQGNPLKAGIAVSINACTPHLPPPPTHTHTHAYS